jgi:hypothetical protein
VHRPFVDRPTCEIQRQLLVDGHPPTASVNRSPGLVWPREVEPKVLFANVIGVGTVNADLVICIGLKVDLM